MLKKNQENERTIHLLENEHSRLQNIAAQAIDMMEAKQVRVEFKNYTVCFYQVRRGSWKRLS
jgi:DNA-binding transcriptional regulator YbjK